MEKLNPLFLAWWERVWIPNGLAAASAPNGKKAKAWKAAGLCLLYPAELELQQIAEIAGSTTNSLRVVRTTPDFVVLSRIAADSLAEFLINGVGMLRDSWGDVCKLTWKVNPSAVDVLLRKALEAADNRDVAEKMVLFDLAVNCGFRLGLITVKVGQGEGIHQKLKGQFVLQEEKYGT